MTGTKIYCVSARSNLQSLIKQYSTIKAKQYAIDIVEAEPLKRLQHHPQPTEQIGEAADEWATIIADVKHEALQSEAQKQFEAFRDQHSWDNIQLESCDELLLTLSHLACISEENTETLSKKLAELEKKTSSGGYNDFGDSTGGKKCRTQANGQSSRGQRLEDFYFDANSQKHTNQESSGRNGGQNNSTEGDADDIGRQFDPRKSSRFYRGIEIKDGSPAASTDMCPPPAPLQLQNLPCPKFDGKITEFHTFRDRFMKFVDDPARNMQEADKMHFLLSQLTGKPLDRCSGFPISTNSYYQILDMLADEYDHPEEVMEVLLHRLRSLKPPKENRHELNEFHCEATRIIRQLDEMGVETNTYEILRTIQSRLPRGTLGELLQPEHEYHPWNTEALLACLHVKVQLERKLVRILNPGALDPDRKPANSDHYTADAYEDAFNHDKGTAAFMFTGKLERLRPQNNYRKNPTRGRRSPPPRSCAATSNTEQTGNSDVESDSDSSHIIPPLTEQEEDELNAALSASTEKVDNQSQARVGYSVLAYQTNGSTHTKLLECAKAEVFNRNNGLSEQVVVFFDSGSDTTYVEREFADRLQLPIKAHDVLDVDTFASKGVKTKMPVTLRSLGVRLVNGEGVKLKVTAGTGLIGNIRSAHIKEEDVPLLRQNKCTIIAKRRRVLPSGFCLVRTLLGPILAGKGHINHVNWASEVATTYRVVVDEPIADDLLARTDENYWQTENIGISLSENEPDDELVFRRHRERLARDEDGRYVTPVPWRTPDGSPVTNNELKPYYGLALGRLNTVLRNQPHEVLAQIDDSFQAQEANGVVEKVDPRERNAYTKHYLASQVVVKETSNTAKLRIVYDASTGSGKHTKSLNDCTHRGPVLTLSDENLVVYRLRRATFGLKPAPFMLAGTLYHHLDSIGTELAAEIKRNCYVDNIVLAADTVEEGLEKYRQTKAIFADAKMNARKFASNSAELISQLPKEDVSTSTYLFHSLGIEWDFDDDSWVMQLNRCSAGKPQTAAARRAWAEGALTRRQMSSRLQAIFDPMGLVSPALIAAKLAIQRTYLLQSKWDDSVPDDIRDLCQTATEGWDTTVIRIPRRVAPFILRDPEVHIFVDASKDAYGIATYLRSCGGPSDEHHSMLVFSRAKVKPASEREKLTIPDLELMAMALGARNAQYIVDNLGMVHSAIYLWSDSMINLQRVVTSWKQKQLWVEPPGRNPSTAGQPTHPLPAASIARPPTVATRKHPLFFEHPLFYAKTPTII